MDVKRLVLHVERVVLDGFKSRDRQSFAEALQLELQRHCNDPGLARALALRGGVSRLTLSGAGIPRSLKPEQVGAWVARVIARGLRT
ncbi:MAG TPA: hypothetical protein VJP84_16880 [Steroidobacteraceae bacterium]|jgi:hypothetical protein|nr:hypothetical protein [Steroidobacteraceae bacterium]